MIETTHSCNITNHLVSGNMIALSLKVDVTIKGQGRSTMTELCVYKVKDGKFISEQFFI